MMAVADLNNDGRLDLTSLDQKFSPWSPSVPPVVLAFSGNGDGTLQAAQEFTVGTDAPNSGQPNWLAIDDFNGDTLADLVVANSSVNSISVFLNTTPSFTLSLTLAGNGGGTITSQLATLNCNSSCAGKFAPGTTATITAAPNAQSIFAGWSGPCSGTASTCTVIMSADQSVTATFTALFPLSVSLAGSGSGTVTSSPTGINCGRMCSSSFVSGTAATLTATPNGASNFIGWSGACSGTGTCTVTMNAAASVTATFALQDFSLTPASTSLTVARGGQSTDVMAIAGVNGSFASSVQLTCAITGPAPMPTCTFSATSVTPGSSSAASTLTITAPTAAAMLDPALHRQLSKSLYAVWLPLMFVFTLVGGSKNQRRWDATVGALLLLMVLLQTACGGAGSRTSVVQQPTNYTVTVTGAAGTIQHTTQVAVTVQ
jgi:hypothetical protein